MKYFIKYLFILGILIVTFNGCSKGGSNPPVVVPDTTKPTITITKPTAGQAFTAGSTILFAATLTDNEALKSCDVAISQKVTGSFALKVVPTSVPFTYTKSAISLGGKSQDISLSDIIIPSNTATTIVTPGVYNVKVTCFDSSNNSSSTIVEININ